MFTGIITDLGIAEKIVKSPHAIRLTVKTNYKLDYIAIGASISCNGCCLTVIEKAINLIHFDISPESLDKTTFKNLKEGDEINLESALKYGDELGGHVVTGHIDGIAEVTNIEIIDGNWKIKFKLPLTFKKYIATKGSVTLNGVSLTVNDVENEMFEVNIIPHTLEKTNLRNLKTGSQVNFEIDLMARYMERLINA